MALSVGRFSPKRFFGPTISALALSVLSCGGTALAQETGLYIAPLVGVIDDNGQKGFESEAGAQFGIGADLSEHWSLEGYVSQYHPEDGPGAQDQLTIGMDLLRVFNRSNRISPYLFAGVGLTDINPDNGPELRTASIASGVGFLTRFKSEGGPELRIELRHRETERFDSEDSFFQIGLQFPFGRSSGRPADSDGDGVIDMIDQCPNTPLGTAVDSRGCPLPLDSDGDGVTDNNDDCPNTPSGARVNARGCELDADNDGVVDRLDRCPNTFAGAPVNAQGCELDDDNDGVVNRLDNCPNTRAGVAIDVNGCEIREAINLPGVNFQSDSDVLLAASTSVLQDAAQTLLNNPEISVEVAGHTDSDGEAAYNEGLSLRRAVAVRDFLIARGVSASRLTVRGYGESEPVASNATADGKRQNRRVVLRVTSR